MKTAGKTPLFFLGRGKELTFSLHFTKIRKIFKILLK